MYGPSVFLFVLLYLLSFIFIINNDDWMMVWLGLEINMMSFILIIYKQMSLIHIESCLKYFFIQSMGSALFLSLFYLHMSVFMYLGMLIMMYKMGAGLFYFWFPSVCSGVEWMSCYLLMTLQKIVPLMLLLVFMSWLIWLMLIISLIMGTIGSFNQLNIKRLMAYSSIHHVGWILLCILLDKSMWFYYLFIYMIVMFPIVYVFSKMNIVNMIDIVKMKKKMFMFFSLLSMAGMPPFLGFFLKWMVFYFLMNSSFSVTLFLILMSVIMFYIYIRMIYDMVLGCAQFSSMNLIQSKFEMSLNLDLLNVLGMMLGLIMMVVIMMYNIKM